ncbi:MAG: ribbon-helix-helix domain-containing protein [Patescibacteria group bacterium]
MRSVINISLPKELTEEVEKQVKKGRYSSKSEFFRDILRERFEEERILRELEKSRKEFAAGKGKILRSLKYLR